MSHQFHLSYPSFSLSRTSDVSSVSLSVLRCLPVSPLSSSVLMMSPPDRGDGGAVLPEGKREPLNLDESEQTAEHRPLHARRGEEDTVGGGGAVDMVTLPHPSTHEDPQASARYVTPDTPPSHYPPPPVRLQNPPGQRGLPEFHLGPLKDADV
uniref:Uncharacterized protein n=1 Tax=Knipowitschia caucasica TaxID=637954 RepID=A0AAV2LUA2_KNICA